MEKALPNFNQLSQYVVNRPGWEGIKSSLYDATVYPVAGTTQLSFFATPLGQGVGFGGVAKTLSDTNMNLAGQLPANQSFLVQQVMIEFWPVTPTVAAQMPSNQAQTTAGFVAQGIVNDAFIFYRSGNLQFTIGSKPYIQSGPLSNFPSRSYFDINTTVAVTGDPNLAQATSLKTSFAYNCGRPFILYPANLLLQSNQNFSVTLNWPEGLQPITTAQGGSNAPARVFLRLDGFLYRRSQ